MNRVGVVGAGRAGATLAGALKRAGYALQGIANRRSTAEMASWLQVPAYASAGALVRDCDTVFLGVPDREIARVCQELAGQGAWRARQVVAHLSGALDSGALESARAGGAHTMSFHPLYSFARRDPDRSLAGVYFAVEGDGAAVSLAEAMISALGGHFLAIPREDKVLYHAAAVMVSNYTVSLAHVATQLLAAIGVPPGQRLEALLPLMAGTVDNLGELGLPDALTGPLVRGDTDTVAGHLRALARLGGDSQCLYRVLGQHALGMIREKLPETTVQVLVDMLGGEDVR